MQKTLVTIIQAIIMAICLGGCIEAGNIKVSAPGRALKNSDHSNNTNRPPVLASISNQVVLNGQAITTINANENGQDVDRDGDVLTYSCFYDSIVNGSVASVTNCSALSGVSFDSVTGVMNWTPVLAQIGQYEFMIVGTDGVYFDDKIFTIEVVGNRAPVLDAISNQTLNEGIAITTINAGDNGSDVDIDGDTITYSCVYDTTVDGSVSPGTSCTSLSGVAFNTTTGVLNWLPGLNQSGVYEFSITGTDGSLDDHAIFTITVIDTNQAPVLAAIGDQTVNENSAITTINANDGGDDFDGDGEAITYSCYFDSIIDSAVLQVHSCTSLSGVTFNTSSGVMDWTPSFVQSGFYEFIIIGTDGSASDSKIFSITVNNTPRAPVLDSIGNQNLDAGNAITTIDANDGGNDTDADGNAITYSCHYDSVIDSDVTAGALCSSLSGLSFSTTTGVLDWTPNNTHVGDHEFKITATSNSMSDDVIFAIIVRNPPPAPFRSVWRTTTNSESITLPLKSSGTYNFEVDWGDGSPTQMINSFNDADKTHTYAWAGIYEVTISGVMTAIFFDGGVSKDKIINVLGLGDIGLTDLSHAFSGCTNLDYFVGGNTSQVTNMSYMFYGATALANANLSGFDTTNVTDMGYMFYGASSLSYLDLENFNTMNVVSMYGMFAGTTDLGGVNMPNFDTTKVTNMSDMFTDSGVYSLDLSSFNTQNVTNMSGMFSNTSRLNNVNLSSFNTIKVTNMYRMFASTGVGSLDLRSFTTTNLVSAREMFESASGLNTLILNYWDTSSLTDSALAFYNKSPSLNVYCRQGGSPGTGTFFGEPCQP